MFVTRFVFGRVEQWINGLAPQFKNREFISASLGLLRIIGLPTNFSRVIARDDARHSRRADRLTVEISNRNVVKIYHTNRQQELADLNELIG